ncbi:hypothetical protein BDV96DRAFT_674600 [Lophiotrema nucula]|uniref:Zn(2)-C6 fungal-type domain-containing protein n=1 Tax=Lophiotrema nucula TaxID=690887 RepID=A0A6A5ZM81_9PLEO|nr:hypothetical protein BDV96DRAFT_674600 [Lophiotrema nucula]
MPNTSKACVTCKRRKIKCGTVETLEQHLAAQFPRRLNVWVSSAAANLFPGNGYSPKDSDRSWRFDYLDLDTTSLALPTACCVSALFFSSKRSAATQDVKSAASYYCKALAQLSSNLQDPQRMLAPANIAAVNLLGVYELAAFDNGRGWMAHAGGLARLIATRGPESHLQEPARMYYKICRLQILSQALVMRQRTFLDEPAWSSAVIWQDTPILSTLTQLVDMLAVIPGLLECSDGVSDIPDPYGLTVRDKNSR